MPSSQCSWSPRSSLLGLKFIKVAFVFTEQGNNLIFIFVCRNTGTIIRTTTVKLLECEKDFICSRCKQTFSVKADFEQYYIIPRSTR